MFDKIKSFETFSLDIFVNREKMTSAKDDGDIHIVDNDDLIELVSEK